MATVVDPQEANSGTESHSEFSKQEPQTPKTRPKQKKTLAQQITKTAMSWTRRIHLFSGLFMFPWVLLYGFTGWFFNHPGYFTSDQVRSFSAASVADGGLASLPSPLKLAGQVVAEINSQSVDIDGPTVQMTSSMSPSYDRYIALDVLTDEQKHRVEVNPVTGAGIVRTTAVAKPAENSAAKTVERNPLSTISKIENLENPLTLAQQLTPQILEHLGLNSGEAKAGRLAANLIFSAEVDGEPCRISYNMASGAITALADRAERPAMTAKSFSQRLHLSRGYAPSWGTKTLWAITVDAMFFSMVFWGMSGIFMWWQIKRTRRIGFILLSASALCAVLLVVGMHDQISSRTRGRGRTATTKPTAAASAGTPTLKTGDDIPGNPRAGRRRGKPAPATQ